MKSKEQMPGSSNTIPISPSNATRQPPRPALDGGS